MATTTLRISAPVPGIRADAVRYVATRLSGVPATTTFYQRAKRVSGTVDSTGAQSGYAGDVTDIVVLQVLTV